MMISKIEAVDYIYYNLHAEQVIRSNYIFESENTLGIYEFQLENQILLDINTDIKSTDLKSKYITKNVVLDFNYIRNFDILNGFDTVKIINEQIKTVGGKLFLLYIKEDLIPENTIGLNNSNSVNILKETTPNNTTKRCYERYCMFDDNFDFDTHPLDAKRIFDDEFTEKIQLFTKDSLEELDKIHISSSVYLNSYIDFKQFISLEKNFALYAIYRLGLKIREKILKLNPENFKKESENKTLVCVSLDSAYIVSILSTLLKLDVLIFDKIGPIDSLYPRTERIINKEREYIVVSDLVCIGTEIKIVKNILKYFGATYIGSAAIIKVATISWEDVKRLRDDHKIENNDITRAVFIIDKSNNKKLKYSISTDLETI